MMMRKVLVALSLAMATPSHAQATVDNPDMTRLFDDDQKLREGGLAKVNVSAGMASDADRRAATKALLDAGKLTTGTDYWHAAFVFQHGGKPEDYLLAHSLAVAAAAKGRADAAWIAAASLDRYLQSMDKPQIYGTQFRWKTGEPVTQEPYAREAVSDSLRAVMGVPPLKEQDRKREKLESERAK